MHRGLRGTCHGGGGASQGQQGRVSEGAGACVCGVAVFVYLVFVRYCVPGWPIVANNKQSIFPSGVPCCGQIMVLMRRNDGTQVSTDVVNSFACNLAEAVAFGRGLDPGFGIVAVNNLCPAMVVNFKREAARYVQVSCSGWLSVAQAAACLWFRFIKCLPLSLDFLLFAVG